MLLLLAALTLNYSIATIETYGLGGISQSGVTASGGFPGIRWDGKTATKLPKEIMDVKAVDDRGGIVGYTSNDDHRAFQLRGETLVGLPPLGDHRECEANGVNSSGVVVGISGPYFSAHAVLWSEEGVKDLGVLPGQKWSHAYGINEAGWIVGSSGANIFQPFLYKDGKMEALPLPEGARYGAAAAINKDGVVVGRCGDKSNVACRWVDGKPQLLGVLPGQYDSEATAINAAGDIIGKSGPKVPWLGDGPVPKELFLSHVFLWRDGTMYDLTALVLKKNPRLFFYEATGINDAGQIVGAGMLDGKVSGLQIFGTFTGIILTPEKATLKGR